MAEIKQELQNSFNIFWEKYPKKCAKPVALRAWVKLKPDTALAQKIMEGLERYKKSELWLIKNGTFIMHPATFLNQERWNDEIKQRRMLLDEDDKYMGLNVHKA